MIIEKLTLYNFKNYDHAEFLFSSSINVITGKNGSGKTNLLDAIHYIGLTKSAFYISDHQTLKKGTDAFSVTAKIMMENNSTLYTLSYEVGGKKILRADKIKYEKISEHIGKVPIVLIAPGDTDIIKDGSEERRRFFDTIICQLDQEYLNNLLKYRHNLKQRNAFLKTVNQYSPIDNNLIEYYNSELIKYGLRIHNVRRDFINRFKPIFQNFYKTISSDNELSEIIYSSQLDENDFEKLLALALPKDIILQRTTTGIHKDDFIFKIQNSPLKYFGSQGQQKSFLICLKLTQFEIIKSAKGFKPTLLLDDIFDKLDDYRITKLMEMISSQFFGQIFITDARSDRSDKYLKRIPNDLTIFKLENGKQVQE